MIFLVKPREGVTGVKFGMLPDEVRRAIGEEWKSFKRTPTSEYPCDYFESLGVFVYYKASGETEAIEFATPAQVMHEGTDLLQLPFDQLTDLLQKQDGSLEVESDGITAYGLGVGAYAPSSADEPTAKVESIIVFEEGYYGKR